MFKSLLSAALSFFIIQGHAQTTTLTVVSDGLHLRARPSSDAASLAIVPFGTEVQCSADSIAAAFPANDVPGKPRQLRIAAVQEEFKRGTGRGQTVRDTTWLYGQWLPVRHGDQRGYMFSAYLYKGGITQPGPDGVELLSEIGDNKVLWQRDWHWYGIYDQKGKALFKPIKAYWIVDWDAEGSQARLITDRKQRALYVLATREPLRPNQYHGNWPNPNGGFDRAINTTLKTASPNTELLKKSRIDIQWESMKKKEPAQMGITKVWVETANKAERQQILPAEGWEKPETWWLENLYIGWYGDLDGDGRRDYILGGPQPEKHYTVFWLFLSGKAEKGKLVKLVSQAGMFDGADLD
jgi:hypothetical protein